MRPEGRHGQVYKLGSKKVVQSKVIGKFVSKKPRLKMVVLLVLAMISCAVAVPFASLSGTGSAMGYVRCPDGSAPLAGSQGGPMACTPANQCPSTHECVNKGGAAGVCCAKGYGSVVTGSPSGPPVNSAPCPPPPEPTEEQAKAGCSYVPKNTSTGPCSDEYNLVCPSVPTPGSGSPTVEATATSPVTTGASSGEPGLDMTTSGGLPSVAGMDNGTTVTPFAVENGSTIVSVSSNESIDATGTTESSNMGGVSNLVTPAMGIEPGTVMNTGVNATGLENGNESHTGFGIDTDIFPLIPTNITGAGENGSLTHGPGTFGPVESNGTNPVSPPGSNTSAEVTPGTPGIEGNDTIVHGVTVEPITPPTETSTFGIGSSPASPLAPFAVDPGVNIHGSSEIPSSSTPQASTGESNTPTVTAEATTVSIIASSEVVTPAGESSTPSSVIDTLGMENATTVEPVSNNGTTTGDVLLSNSTSTELPGAQENKTVDTLTSIDEPGQHRPVPPGINETAVEPTPNCPPDAPSCPLSNKIPPTSSPSPSEGGASENGTGLLPPSPQIPPGPGSSFPNSPGTTTVPPTGPDMTNLNATVPSDVSAKPENGTATPSTSIDEPGMATNGSSTEPPTGESTEVTAVGQNGSSTLGPAPVDHGFNVNGTSEMPEIPSNGSTPATESSTTIPVLESSTIPAAGPETGMTLEGNGTTEVPTNTNAPAGNESTEMPEAPLSTTPAFGGIDGSTEISQSNETQLPIDFGNSSSTPSSVVAGGNESVNAQESTAEPTSFNATTPSMSEHSNTSGTPSEVSNFSSTPESSNVSTSSPSASTPGPDQLNGSSPSPSPAGPAVTPNISESINPNPQSVNPNDKPTWDSMFSIRSPQKSIPDAVAFRRNSGPAVATSGQFVPCQRNADCFGLREPPEWCDRDQASYTWTDKSCFCAADTEVQSCIIERFDLTSGQAQWTFCTPDNEFVCDKNFRRKL